MTLQFTRERRREVFGGIVCENGALRMRVVRTHTSLCIHLEARNAEGRWVTMAMPLQGSGITMVDDRGHRVTAQLHTYDPVLVNGRSIGVTLHGHIDHASLTVISLLDRPQAWCQHYIEVSGVSPSSCKRFTQSWVLLPECEVAPVCWPVDPAYGTQLAHTPVALCQDGAYFAALVPELVDGECEKLGLQVRPDASVEVEYGYLTVDARSVNIPEPMRMGYSLCLDARAIPDRGFQEVVRWLGSHQMPVCPQGAHAIALAADALPAYPAVAQEAVSRPFVQEEGSAVIAARVHKALSATEAGEWDELEDGLCWLDRLCLQQRVSAVQGETAVGSLPDSPAWHSVALWLPGLLLRAFRLTGISEYANRAYACFNALSPSDRARVLNHVYRQFGDVYVHVDYREAVVLCGLPITVSLLNEHGIDMRTHDCLPDRPLRLVVEGDRDVYTLLVNGKEIGALPSEQLRGGVELTEWS